MVKRLVRKLVPNRAVNLGKHLPEAVIANVKYGFPSKKMKIIGVTGTDGKTTTTNMIYHILKDAGKKVSMVSTINAMIGDKSYDTGFHVTSPRALDVQKYIAQAKKAGSEYFVLEVTSHALDQYRVWGIKFYIGVITNITHEHLDYHKTFDNYVKAKAKLTKNANYAVLNKDDKNYDRLKRMANGQVVSISLREKADFNLKTFPITLKIPGNYNLSNALQAAAVAQILRIDSQTIRQTLKNFQPLSGRMEKISNDKGLQIFVDFAHTPHALDQALSVLRSQKKGKLISVFGCASERDVQKRPLMGSISARQADITILTDEDPRFENGSKIIEQIAVGAVKAGAKPGENLFKEPDRQKAIEMALSLAKRGDTIGIFGKGHEKSMNYFGEERPWSDKEAVVKALSQDKITD